MAANAQNLRGCENATHGHGVIAQDHTQAAAPVGQGVGLPVVSEGGGQAGVEPVVVGCEKTE